MESQERSKVCVISGDILGDTSISPSEKLVYARICFFEVYFESAKATAEFLGVSEWAVQSAKRKLEKAGYIVCICNTGRGKQYVADVNLTTFQRDSNRGSKVRVGKKQGLVWEKPKSDIGNTKVRLGKYQDIDKEIDKDLNKNIEEREGESSSPPRPQKSARFEKPSVEEVKAYCESKGYQIDPENFVDFYESNGWKVGKNPMRSWQAAVRNWARRENWSSPQQSARVIKSEVIYQPKDGEDITYQRMFEAWKQYLGVSQPQTPHNVQSCKALLEDLGEEGLVKLIVALRMRSEHSYLTKDITGIQDFAGLNQNAMAVQAFYDKHWREWKRWLENEKLGKKRWEL